MFLSRLIGSRTEAPHVLSPADRQVSEPVTVSAQTQKFTQELLSQVQTQLRQLKAKITDSPAWQLTAAKLRITQEVTNIFTERKNFPRANAIAYLATRAGQLLPGVDASLTEPDVMVQMGVNEFGFEFFDELRIRVLGSLARR